MWEWQWSDFVITVIGSLLGFFFAILASYGMNWAVDRSKRRDIISKIEKELKTARGKKDKIIDNIGSDELGYSALSLPYLEGIVKTNQISLLTNEPWFDGMMDLFNLVEEFNNWYKARTDFFMRNVQEIMNDKGGAESVFLKNITSELSKSVQAVYDMIDRIAAQIDADKKDKKAEDK